MGFVTFTVMIFSYCCIAIEGARDAKQEARNVPGQQSHGSKSLSAHSYAITALKQEFKMDWNRVEGNWKQVKGKIKEQWGKLTDDDLDVIDGKRDQLEGKIQERYGYEKDRATKDIDDWYGRQTW